MAYNFYKFLLKDGSNILDNMPPITITPQSTDIKIIYDKKITRIDRIAGDIYDDETLGRIIMWANPEYDYEFDIPDGTVIRVPFPINYLIQDIIVDIKKNKNLK